MRLIHWRKCEQTHSAAPPQAVAGVTGFISCMLCHNKQGNRKRLRPRRPPPRGRTQAQPAAAAARRGQGRGRPVLERGRGAVARPGWPPAGTTIICRPAWPAAGARPLPSTRLEPTAHSQPQLAGAGAASATWRQLSRRGPWAGCDPCPWSAAACARGGSRSTPAQRMGGVGEEQWSQGGTALGELRTEVQSF